MSSVPFLNGYSQQMNPALQVTLLSGGTKTPAINLNGFTLCGIFLPATFTGTTLTFEASIDGVTFVAVKSTTSGSALSYTVAQNTFAAIDPKDFQGIRYLKIVSGSTEGADRVLTLAVKGF